MSINACYPAFVQELYVNLHVDKDGNYISHVRDQEICLNSSVLNGILKCKGLSDELLNPFTKKGCFMMFDDLSKIDQYRLVRGDDICEDTSMPITAMLSPLAHVLFKICRTNICPRMRNRSILICQELIVVSPLLVGKKFDLSGLILKHMIGCKKKKIALPFRFLLTKNLLVLQNEARWYGQGGCYRVL